MIGKKRSLKRGGREEKGKVDEEKGIREREIPH